MSLLLTPSYTGFIGSTKDAVLVIQAVLLGDFPLVDHRPQDRERAELIKSGNVFVFIEESSGIKRWTDGISWSASRILGRFLVYRELDPSSMNEKDDKRKRRKHLELIPLRKLQPVDYQSDAGLVSDFHRSHLDYRPYELVAPDYVPLSAINTAPSASLSAPHAPGAPLNVYPRQYSRETPHQVVQDHGLIKKTLSVTTGKENSVTSKENKQTIHLISYYSAHDVLLGKLSRPSHGNLKNLPVPPLLWEAVKKSSLGGKIPIEDEAYYYLDSNYQLQNMSVLLNSRADTAKKQPLTSVGSVGSVSSVGSSHQPVAKSVQHNPSKLPYVLPVPFSGPAPPIAFHADYVPPLFQQLGKQSSANSIDTMKKEDDSAELGSVSTYSAPTSLQTYNHPNTYGYPEQRSPEIPLLLLQFGPAQTTQYPLYDQLLHHHHHHHHPHHPQQMYSLPGPSGTLDQHYLTQDGAYPQGYPGQYPGVPYQLYNSTAYFNPGGGQIVQPANTNLSPTGNVPGLTSQQVQQPPPQALSSTDSQPQALQQPQHLPQSADYGSGHRAGFYGGAVPLNASGTTQTSSVSKRSVEYPEYFAPAEEPYNYN